MTVILSSMPRRGARGESRTARRPGQRRGGFSSRRLQLGGNAEQVSRIALLGLLAFDMTGEVIDAAALGTGEVY